MATVVMLVLLRLSLGVHFLYEGVWKIKHPEFTAEPFLTQAKGPASRFFYAMVPDIDGRQRLAIDQDEKKRPYVSSAWFVDRWEGIRQQAVGHYGFDEAQQKKSEETFNLYRAALEGYLEENRDEMVAHFKSLDNFEAQRDADNTGTAFMQKRFWDKQQELRGKVNGWLAAVEKIEKDYQIALAQLATDEQRAEKGGIRRWNPLGWSQMELIDFAVTYGLTAIGLCLLLGFCTRLAAIGGGCFMAFVVLTQPSWPTIYPPAPPVVGHALLINKDWIEMMALFTLATTAAGRWGGLDYFLWFFFGRRLENYMADRLE